MLPHSKREIVIAGVCMQISGDLGDNCHGANLVASVPFHALSALIGQRAPGIGIIADIRVARVPGSVAAPPATHLLPTIDLPVGHPIRLVIA